MKSPAKKLKEYLTGQIDLILKCSYAVYLEELERLPIGQALTPDDFYKRVKERFENGGA